MSDKKEHSRLICSRPFSWCDIHPDGQVFLCCPGWLKRPIGQLLTQSVDAIWNSASAVEIRKSILNHSFHNCNQKRCPYLATASGPVQRQEQISEPDIQTAISSQQCLLPYRPKQLNLCFDHSCNLSCPSCRNGILQANGKALQQARQIADILHSDWIPTAEEITLSGYGDPFGSPTYLQLLERLCDLPRIPQIRLHSNGQRLDLLFQQPLQALQQQLTAVEISIDAARANSYRLNRPGGSFARLLNQLEQLAQLAAPLTLSMVVQQNNFHEIPELIELARRFGAGIYLSQLVNWGSFRREEFIRRAVHRPNHPQHRQLVTILHSIAHNPVVNLGNLSPLVTEPH